MHDENSITFRLESYLLQLADMNQRWNHWLSLGEIAVVLGDKVKLAEFESNAVGLIGELEGMLDSRQQLLNDAQEIGLTSTDLRSLAQRLPAWNRPRLRASVANANQQLANLRRLHVATWILINQRLQLYRDSISVMMAGKMQQAVYLPTQALEGGGLLLDASL